MEVEYAIKKMKDGKARGEDEIPVESFKAIQEVKVGRITRVVNAAWGDRAKYLSIGVRQ